MRKLSVPPHDRAVVYDTCVAEISDAALKQLYVDNANTIHDAYADFDAATTQVSWATLPRSAWGNPHQIVAGTLTKKHLTDLYGDYLAGEPGRPSRNIYNEIIVASGGKCPFCGGLGQVHTLDHYLPKFAFPLYSVLPANLVPCCRDCNSGKKGTFGHTLDLQPLHPYLDDEKFFLQRWVHAEIVQADPIVARFYCHAPDAWADLDKARVAEHFTSYKLASRFALQSGGELSRAVTARKGSLRRLSPEDYHAHLLESANSSGFDLNGWNRSLFQGLADAQWFWQADFTDPDWLNH